MIWWKVWLYYNPASNCCVLKTHHTFLMVVQTADGSHLANVTDEEMQDHYDNFFEDVFVECEDKYGQVCQFFILFCTPTLCLVPCSFCKSEIRT
jgi:hypothetical protein